MDKNIVFFLKQAYYDDIKYVSKTEHYKKRF